MVDTLDNKIIDNPNKQTSVKPERVKIFSALNSVINNSVKSDNKIEIKSFEDIKKLDKTQRKSLFELIKNQRKELLNHISFQEKKSIIENIANNSSLDVDEKLTLSDQILSLEEKQQWIRELLKDQTDKKEVLKNKIMSFFRVEELVNSIPPYNRKDGNTPDFLAKKANISDYNRTGDQNEKIRKRILDVMLDLNKLNNAGADVLDDQHTSWLNEKIVNIKPDSGVIIDAISALSLEERTKINSFTKEQFEQFIDELNILGLKNAETIGNNFGIEDGEKSKDILSLNLAMSTIKERIDSYEIKITKQISNINIPKVYNDYLRKENLEPKNEKENTLLRAKFLKEYVKTSKDIDEKTRADLLEEGNSIEKDIYAVYSKYERTGELKNIRGPAYYNKVEKKYEDDQKITQKLNILDISVMLPHESQQAWQKFSGDLAKNEIFDQEIYQIKELPQKDLIKTEDFLKFEKIPERYQEFIGKDGALDKDLMSKGDISQNKQERLLKKYNPENAKNTVEKTLLQETNNITKNQLIEQVVLFLQDTLNVQIDQKGKENLIEQFANIKNNMQGSTIKIDGDYQGQKITFGYDCITGSLTSNNWLSKEKGQNNIYINQDKLIPIQGLYGPNIQGILEKTKNINYPNLVSNAKGDYQKYHDDFAKEMKNLYPQKFPTNSEKDILKKQYLGTILAQEMFDMLGLKKPKNQESINTTVFPIYKNLYNSISNYTIDELQLMRENINTLYRINTDIKTGKFIQKGKDNKAAQILLKLFNLTEEEQTKTVHSASHFNGFFDSMLSNQARGEEQIQIIDPKEILGFITDVQQTKDDRSIAYDADKLQNTMSPFLADNYLENNENARTSNQA